MQKYELKVTGKRERIVGYIQDKQEVYKPLKYHMVRQAEYTIDYVNNVLPKMNILS